MTEAAQAAVRVTQVIEVLDHLEHGVVDPLDHQLSDPLPTRHLERLGGVGVDEQHLQLPPVAAVDESGGVEAGHAVVEGETAARLDEAGVALGDGHRQPGRHQGATTAGCEDGTLAGQQVQAGITRAGVGREREIGVQTDDRELEHAEIVGKLRRIPDVLAWMDLEMTGLDPTRHTIVEIATLVTDDDLELVAEGPDLVVHQPPAALAEMDDVVVAMHTRSGLLPAIEASTVTLEEAGEATLAFLREHLAEGAVPLCGNSIGTDRRFLAAHLPRIEAFLHYRSVDVSTLKELIKRWNPALLDGAPRKAEGHRALDDIRESVNELRYYREAFCRVDGPSPVATPDDRR